MSLVELETNCSDVLVGEVKEAQVGISYVALSTAVIVIVQQLFGSITVDKAQTSGRHRSTTYDDRAEAKDGAVFMMTTLKV